MSTMSGQSRFPSAGWRTLPARLAWHLSKRVVTMPKNILFQTQYPRRRLPVRCMFCRHFPCRIEAPSRHGCRNFNPSAVGVAVVTVVVLSAVAAIAIVRHALKS